MEAIFNPGQWPPMLYTLLAWALLLICSGTVLLSGLDQFQDGSATTNIAAFFTFVSLAIVVNVVVWFVPIPYVLSVLLWIEGIVGAIFVASIVSAWLKGNLRDSGSVNASFSTAGGWTGLLGFLFHDWLFQTIRGFAPAVYDIHGMWVLAALSIATGATIVWHRAIPKPPLYGGRRR